MKHRGGLLKRKGGHGMMCMDGRMQGLAQGGRWEHRGQGQG